MHGPLWLEASRRGFSQNEALEGYACLAHRVKANKEIWLFFCIADDVIGVTK